MKIGIPPLQRGEDVNYLYMMTELDTEAFVTGVIWCVLGIAVYLFCTKDYQKLLPGNKSKGSASEGEGSGPDSIFTLDEDASGINDVPPPDEKKRMDREYKLWWWIVGSASVLALALYGLPYL